MEIILLNLRLSLGVESRYLSVLVVSGKHVNLFKLSGEGDNFTVSVYAALFVS